MHINGDDPAASFFISGNIQYSHSFETIHLFIKIKSSKRHINPQYSVTELNCHSESVFQDVALLHPHNSMRALRSLAWFHRPEVCAEFKLFIGICKNQLPESNSVFRLLKQPI